MKARWQRDEYTDKLTGELLAVEVLPVADARRHLHGEHADECDCVPVIKQSRGVTMLVHNSFDGREYSEPNCKEKGH